MVYLYVHLLEIFKEFIVFFRIFRKIWKYVCTYIHLLYVFRLLKYVDLSS